MPRSDKLKSPRYLHVKGRVLDKIDIILYSCHMISASLVQIAFNKMKHHLHYNKQNLASFTAFVKGSEYPKIVGRWKYRNRQRVPVFY